MFGLGVLDVVYGLSFGASHQECSEAFGLVNELLLRLYYLYEKSPRRCRELEDIITSGSRWVAHKQNAMKRVLSKFGIYTAHLVALAKDRSLKLADCVKLKGYYNKWTDAKYLSLWVCSFCRPIDTLHDLFQASSTATKWTSWEHSMPF